MSGEGPQPGGRPPAPGELGLVQAFINTHYDLEREHGAEVLSDAGALRHWLGDHGLIEADTVVTAADVRRAIAVREALRALAGGHADDSDLTALRGATMEIRLDAAGPRFEPSAAGTVDGALAALLAIVAREMLTGRWSRVKVCPGHDCGWAFYDGSRNRTGRWCSMSVCGGRSKAKTHYRRQRGLA
jgi:predicted RNA-binding Zn ribbon-like protein